MFNKSCLKCGSPLDTGINCVNGCDQKPQFSHTKEVGNSAELSNNTTKATIALHKRCETYIRWMLHGASTSKSRQLINDLKKAQQ